MPLQGTLQISKTASLFPSQRWSNAQRDRRLLVPFGCASSVPRRRWITIVWCSSSVLRRRWTPLMGCPDGLSSLAAQITITLCVLDGFTIIGSAYHHPYVCCYLRCHSSSLSLATDALSSRRKRSVAPSSATSSSPSSLTLVASAQVPKGQVPLAAVNCHSSSIPSLHVLLFDSSTPFIQSFLQLHTSAILALYLSRYPQPSVPLSSPPKLLEAEVWTEQAHCSPVLVCHLLKIAGLRALCTSCTSSPQGFAHLL